MTILTDVRPTLDGVKVLGVVTSQFCPKDGTNSLSYSEQNSVSQSHSFTTSSSQTYSFSASLSVAVKAHFEPLGVGGGITVTAGVTAGTSHQFSSSKSQSSTSGSSSTAGSSISYSGTILLLLSKRYLQTKKNPIFQNFSPPA